MVRLSNNDSWTGIRQQRVLRSKHYVNNEVFQVERTQKCVSVNNSGLVWSGLVWSGLVWSGLG